MNIELVPPKNRTVQNPTPIGFVLSNFSASFCGGLLYVSSCKIHSGHHRSRHLCGRVRGGVCYGLRFFTPEAGHQKKMILVGGLEHEFYDFPIILGTMIPTDFNSIIFQRGLETTNQDRFGYLKIGKILEVPWFGLENCPWSSSFLDCSRSYWFVSPSHKISWAVDQLEMWHPPSSTINNLFHRQFSEPCLLCLAIMLFIFSVASNIVQVCSRNEQWTPVCLKSRIKQVSCRLVQINLLWYITSFTS